MQEDYIKEEQRNLKKELLRAEEEVKRIQSVPLVLGQFLEMVDATSGVVTSTTGVVMFFSTKSARLRSLARSRTVSALQKEGLYLEHCLHSEHASNADDDKALSILQAPTTTFASSQR